MATQEKDKVIRVGSRKSELALIQTKHVIGRLQKLYPKQKFEIHTMSTFGDRVLNVSLPKIGEKSLFTRDLEDALRNGGVDFVVHSLKDLPTALPTGMAVGAVLEREDARDALVLRENLKGHTIANLPKGSVIGTSSLRRTAQIRRQYPDLIVCDIRGNLNTRLAKLDAKDSKFAGIILAQAGLVRMGWMARISQVLEPTDLLYAVGQGALAVECRANDNQVLGMLQKLMCLNTTCRILAERSFLKTLGGGCSAPVAVWSNLNGEPSSINREQLLQQQQQEVGLSLTGAVWSLDGAIEIREHLDCALNDCDVDVQRRKRAANEQPKQLEQQLTNGNQDNSNSCDSPPAMKRARNGNSSPGNANGTGSGSSSGSDSNSSSPRLQGSPPVICEDAAVTGYSMEELLERHIDLARKCPVIGHDNNNAQGAGGDAGGGGDNANVPAHCPLLMDVGQDVMGECPFVSNEAKISYSSAGKCPITHTATLPTPPPASGDEPDNAPTSSSKCPFAAMHKGSGLEVPPEKTGHAKCPFLQKTVQMFDYADEEQPQPQQLKLPVLIEDVDNLFCGLYQHACHSRDIYVKANLLGQTLAEQLIKRGALDVMKLAQAEIHSKVGA
ncbi:porphobilinogen deaminase [Drosophila grimshawi]|uniref:hydroxymethylbilane synthase n=1 Tax=Drosophila grimshawi TaxID=7222 RepID=B4IXG6_DROGR|nr:porphobilinogen deaminase [Drosophila grimshawi]EDV96403.1 GH15218 [Drosophila grimshawi]